MELYERGLFFSLCSLNIILITMKLVLMRTGHKVSWIHQWGYDYNRYKELTNAEGNHNTKWLYSIAIYGLKASGVALVIFALIGFVSSR